MEPFVDVAFSLKGKSLPLDHGYALFGAVSRLVPRLHDEPDWAIHPVYGHSAARGTLFLVRQSALTLRLPSSSIAAVLRLAGAELDIAGHRVVVGVPRLSLVVAHPRLRSRFVTIKGFHEGTRAFEDAFQRRLAVLSVDGSTRVTVGERRVMRVAEHTIVGFPVVIEGLEEEQSVRLQIKGVGGRRHMGAGVFIPARGTATDAAR